MTVPGLTIRDGRADERLALEGLQRRASLAYADYRRQILDNPEIVELPRAYLDCGHVRVALEGARLLGFAVVLPRDGYGDLDGLFVEPGHWRRGIGRALIADACARLRRPLHTVANPKAEGFYERLGFTDTGIAQTLFGPARRMVLEIWDFPPAARQS